MKRWILILFIFPLTWCHSLCLKEKFLKAEPGTFIVTEQNKTTTLLHVHSKTENELILEEISIPSHLLPSQDWHAWIASGAEGHTSWILYAIDLDENFISECYSFTRAAHLPRDHLDAYLLTLINLHLEPLPYEERLQTGASSRPGEVALSKPWGPPMIKQGKKVQEPSYTVFTATWPHDHSELSGKKMVLYFDKEWEDFPFPYWIQAREGGLKFKVRACDSGRNLKTPHQQLPRRSPTFIGGFTHKNGKTFLTLSAPSYYHNFQLFAVDISAKPRTTHTFSFHSKREKESLHLELDQEEMRQKLIPGHQYVWLATSEDHDIYVEMDHPVMIPLSGD